MRIVSLFDAKIQKKHQIIAFIRYFIYICSIKLIIAQTNKLLKPTDYGLQDY